MLTNINFKELSKPITIKGVPIEVIAVAFFIAVLAIVIHLFVAIALFFIALPYLVYLSKKDVDIIKIFFAKARFIGQSHTKKNGKNCYVS